MDPYVMLTDFIVQNIDADKILDFRASEEAHDRLYSLLDKEKAGKATPEEMAEIDRFMQVEHILRLAKAKAEQYVHQ